MKRMGFTTTVLLLGLIAKVQSRGGGTHSSSPSRSSSGSGPPDSPPSSSAYGSRPSGSSTYSSYYYTSSSSRSYYRGDRRNEYSVDIYYKEVIGTNGTEVVCCEDKYFYQASSSRTRMQSCGILTCSSELNDKETEFEYVGRASEP